MPKLILCAAALALSGGAIGATIGDLAPARSFLVAGVDNWSTTQAAFERTGYHALWEEPSIQAWLGAVADENAIDPRKWLEDRGVDTKDLKPPKGMAGMALFIERDDARPGAEAEEAAPRTQMMFVADYEDDAEGADALMEALEESIADAERKGYVERDGLEHAGVQIERYVIDYEAIDADMAEDEPEDAEEGMEEFDEWIEEPIPFAERGLNEVVLIARRDNTVLAATHLETLRDAIDRLGGADLGPTAGDDDAFQGALGQHGPNPHGYLVALVDPLVESLRDPEDSPIAGWLDTAAPEMLEMLSWIEPAADALGLDDIRALSASVRLDTAEAMSEISFALLTPSKDGVLGLVDGAPQAFEPPAFAGAESTLVFMQRFNFDRLLPLVRAVGNALPEPQKTSMMAAVDQLEPQAAPILAALGDHIVVAQRIERPYAVASKRTLIGLRVTDPEGLRNAIGSFAAVVGFASRDFQGSPIWESQFIGPALGLAGGYLLIGDTESLETGLRAIGDPNAARLAQERRFIDAAAALGGEGQGHLFVDTRTDMEYASWTAEHMEEIFAAQMDEFGIPEEERAEYLEMFRADVPASSKLTPRAEVYAKHLGDNVGQLRSRADGFVWRTLQLRPR